MVSDAKTIWFSGMFLRAEHFQQETRYLQRTVRDSVIMTTPYHWGLSRYELSDDRARDGAFALSAAEGIFPDGTPFKFGDTAQEPTLLKLENGVQDSLVFLTVPSRASTGADVALDPEKTASHRFLSQTVPVASTVQEDSSVDDQGIEIEVGRLNLSYRLQDRDLDGFETLPIARILRKDHTGHVEIDEDFIPPVLSIGTSGKLMRTLEWISSKLNQYTSLLAANVSQLGAARRRVEPIDYLKLQILNRSSPVARQWLEDPRVHPHQFYLWCVALAGELSTYTAERARPPEFLPPYRHNDIRGSFVPVLEELARSFDNLVKLRAIQVELVPQSQNVLASRSLRKDWVESGTFILIAQGVPPNALRSKFPEQLKITSLEQILSIVDRSTRGVPVEALSEIPRDLPSYEDAVYFQLQASNDFWPSIASAMSIALHVAKRPANLDLQLWVLPAEAAG